MAQKPKRVLSQKRYNVLLKRKIAQDYLAGKASYQVLANDYGLKNKDVVKEFVKWYKRIIEKESKDFQMRKDTDKSDQPADNKQTREELLEMIRQEQLKNEMLEALIIEANQALQINIKKNFGTKQ